MRVTPHEWRWATLFALALAVFTLIPYLVGWASAGETWFFNGFVFGVDDGNAYLGKIRIGLEGDWRFSLFYTPEAHESALGLYLPHILVGHALRLPFSPGAGVLVGAFHVWRFLSAVALVLAMYRFIAEFLNTVQARWLALVLATLGGGLGWVLVLLGQTEWLGTLPPEFYIPEGFSFLVLMGLPHIASARMAMLLGLLLLIYAIRSKHWRLAVAAGLCFNLVGLMVTFYLAVIYALLGAWGITWWIRKRAFPVRLLWYGGTAALLTLPLFLYNAWLFTANPAFAQWASQNYLPSPHPLQYGLAYGLLAVLATVGARRLWAQAEPAHTLLIGWVLMVPVLVYLPLNVQRRLAEGVLVPLAILASVGMRTRVVSQIVLPLSLLSALLFWIVTLFGAAQPHCDLDSCPFRLHTEQAAMRWLDDYAEPGAVVLGSFRTGNFLPVQTDLRPVYGHGPETLYSDQKEEWVEDFYRGRLSSEEQQRGLRRWNVRFVWHGPLEVGHSFWKENLRMIYEKSGYTIYEVEAP